MGCQRPRRKDPGSAGGSDDSEIGKKKNGLNGRILWLKKILFRESQVFYGCRKCRGGFIWLPCDCLHTSSGQDASFLASFVLVLTINKTKVVEFLIEKQEVQVCSFLGGFSIAFV